LAERPFRKGKYHRFCCKIGLEWANPEALPPSDKSKWVIDILASFAPERAVFVAFLMFQGAREHPKTIEYSPVLAIDKAQD
jgi:hypothetical protein